MWIDRDFGEVLSRAAATRPAVVLTGARQTGKTSLLKALFPKHGFVSLDLPAEARAAEDDPDAFLRAHPPPLVVDEVQYAPGLFRHLKRAIDERRSEKGLFVLTGSQKFTLMRAVSDSLAGRVQLLELEPLSLKEVARRAAPIGLVEALVRGGYPELHAEPDLDPTAFYASYVATYLERDVRNLLNVSQLRDFERFIRACALRSGQMLNKAEMARDVGISPSTANQWLSVLEASNQISLLEPWFSNRLKAMVKTPKLYLRDTGLLCFLLNIHGTEELLRSPLLGSIWETFVFTELRKRLLLEGRADALFYWRDRQREVDFVIHRGGRFELLDAKWTETPRLADAQGILSVAGELGSKAVESMTLVARPARGHSLGQGVRAATLPERVEAPPFGP